MTCSRTEPESWDEDPDDVDLDEDPSDADVERFGDETAYCPDCGARVWDEADICPKCHAYIGGQTLSRPPTEHGLRKRWLAVIAIILLLAMLWWLW